VISSLFHSFPYGGNSKVMNGFALAFFFLNIILFFMFLALSVACYIMFPRIWRSMLHHPVQSLYLGCFPMGADTLITVGIIVVSQYWGFGGNTFVYVLWGFWWLDGILSFLCCFGLVYVMYALHPLVLRFLDSFQHRATRHDNSMSTLTPVWLLPVVTLIVCSSTGQLLAKSLIPIHLPHAFLTMGVSVVMVCIGISLALMILTVYMRRILIDGLPDLDMIISSFLPLGPCGQAGYSLLIAGQNFKETLPWGTGNVLGDDLSGRILNVCCLFAAFLLWCLGVWWLLMAFIAVGDVLLRGRKIPFKLAFWGLVFPNVCFSPISNFRSFDTSSSIGCASPPHHSISRSA
jgi:tellurite resistance protein TehA-like permease